MQGIQNFEEFLENAKKYLEEEKNLKDKISYLEDELAKKESELESEIKALEDQIDITIKTRLAKLTKSYDDEYNILLDKLKKVKANREKAKNLGVKERIEVETKELKELNKGIKQKIKDEMKSSSTPFFTNTHLFMSIYMPSKLSEFITLLITFILCYALVPLGIFYFLPWKVDSIIKIFVIYIVIILVFGSIYIFVANISKYKHLKSLKLIKAYRKEIYTNKKQIKSIKRSIKNDKDEEQYNLASFDDDISHIDKEISEVLEKKQDAINTFENVTKNIIIDELRANIKSKIDSLNEEVEVLQKEIKKAENIRKELSLKISSEYEVYLGKEFLTIDKISELENIIKENQVLNISEAIEIYKANSGSK